MRVRKMRQAWLRRSSTFEDLQPESLLLGSEKSPNFDRHGHRIKTEEILSGVEGLVNGFCSVRLWCLVSSVSQIESTCIRSTDLSHRVLVLTVLRLSVTTNRICQVLPLYGVLGSEDDSIV